MSVMESRAVLGMFSAIAPGMTWMINSLIPGRNAAVMRTESANKCKIMMLVNGLSSYIDETNSRPLQQMVDQCYSLGSFPALWAVEGLGKDLSEWHMLRNPNPRGILSNAELDPKSRGAWLMLHAGIGMGFARQPILDLPSNAPPAQIGDFALRFLELCRANSRPGYAGAAIESLGLVSRFMKNAEFCATVHRELTRSAPDALGYFWRGVGRCLYFHPENFMPAFGARIYRALDMADAEAPSPELKQTLYSGMAWALTVVNMMSPEVMEYVLANLSDGYAGSPGFVNGITAATVMRYDTTPGEPLIREFLNHRCTDPKLDALWAEKVRASCEFAINNVHPALDRHQRLEEVFRYQSLPGLIANL